MAPSERAQSVRDQLPSGGLFARLTWRIAPAAFPLAPELVQQFELLGPQLRAFYRACNTLYRHSLAGPTSAPTVSPSLKPSKAPSNSPSTVPTTSPTQAPSSGPTLLPSLNPTLTPSVNPTANPTLNRQKIILESSGKHLGFPPSPITLG